MIAYALVQKYVLMRARASSENEEKKSVAGCLRPPFHTTKSVLGVGVTPQWVKILY